MTVIKKNGTVVLLLLNSILFLFIFSFGMILMGVDPWLSVKKLVYTASSVALRATKKPLCKDCNVILISLDTLSANHLPCYGYGRNTAPNLCAYGKSNIFFSNVSSNATFTLPSHVSLFTGLLPSQHGVNKPNTDKLKPTIPFLPEIMQKNGYKTLFYMPEQDSQLPEDLVYNRGIDEIHTATEPADWKDGLLQLKDNSTRGKKTFLFLHTYYVHSPYLIGDKPLLYAKEKVAGVPTTYNELSACSDDFISYLRSALGSDMKAHYWGDKAPVYQTLLTALESEDRQGAVEACVKNSDLIFIYRLFYFYRAEYLDSPARVEFAKALYDQKIHELDAELASVFSFLRTSGLEKNTLIILTADHGEEFMEHNFLSHITLYNSNVRVPLIMHIPGQKQQTVSSLSQTVDILPTILETVGIRYPAFFQGESLVQDLYGVHDPGKLIIGQIYSIQQTAIRNENYKLFTRPVKGKIFPYELFDEKKDPDEKRSILMLKPAVADSLLKSVQSLYR